MWDFECRVSLFPHLLHFVPEGEELVTGSVARSLGQNWEGGGGEEREDSSKV